MPSTTLSEPVASRQAFDLEHVHVCSTQIGVDDALIALNCSGCTFGKLPTEMQHDDTFAYAHDETHIVLDQKDRCIENPLTQMLQQLAEFRDLPLRQSRRGLIKEQQLRLSSERATSMRLSVP